MRGHLHLTAARNELGQTYLRRQSFRAPMHLSKPHEDAGALVVNMVNPTAGLFDGDEIDCRIQVEEGARLVVTNPSASRVYKARRENQAAVVTQSYQVAGGGFLEFFPELLIPQAGARYRQMTELRVETGGTLLFFEWLSPGRVARGEVFQFEELVWDTDVHCGGRLAARERYTLRPADESLTALRQLHPESHYLGCFVAGELTFPTAAVEALNSPDVYIGHGPLVCPGAWTIKALCKDSLNARRVMKSLRTVFYQALGRFPPTLGRF